MIGQQLLHYEILSRLGENPVGAIYKARDIEAGRLVAITVLSPEVSNNPERRQRIHEAVAAAAALNHPNLGRLYELVHDDGQDFIISELAEGESLDTILRRERLHRRDLFSFARQIAAALDAVHTAGLVHGGLQGGCVVLDSQRRIKVLDCGLARALGEESEQAAPEVACYYSPEQVEGKELDERSDIFSFGALLYHMSSRRRPFRRDSLTATLEAVQREEPKAIDGVTKHAPRGIEKIIKRCLRKDPARRFQHIADVEEPLEKLDADYLAKKGVPGGRPQSKRSEKMLPWIFAIVLLGAVTAGVIFWMQGLSNKTSNTELTQITLDTGFDSEPAISSSAQQVAYASDRSGEGNLDIWIQSISGRAPVRLTNHPADDREPSISPDGMKVVFRSERDGGGIYIVQSSGGDARRLVGGGRRPRFSPDGKWIAYWAGRVDGASSIYVIAVEGGEPRQIAPGFAGAYPVWSPDGASLLFLGRKGATLGSTDVDWWVAFLDGSPAQNTNGCRALHQHAVLRVEGCVAPGDWKGKRIYFSLPDGAASNVWDAEMLPTREIIAKPSEVTSGDGIRVQPCATEDGKVVFSKQSLNVDIWGVPIRANEGKVAGEWRKLTTDPSADLYPSLSADGSKLVYQSNRRGIQNVWLMNLTSRTDTPVLPERKGLLWPRITPDGAKVSFAEEIAGKYDRFYIPVSGGNPQPLCQGCGPVMDWSRDGSRALIEDTSSKNIAVVKPGSRDKAAVLAGNGSTLAEPRFSPDERWIAFADRTGEGGSRVYVAPLHGESTTPSSEWVLLTKGDAWEAAPQWSPDGRLVYFISNRDGQRCIWARRIEDGKAMGDPFAVYHFHDARRSPANTPLAATDLFVGKDQIVIGVGELSGSLWAIDSRN